MDKQTVRNFLDKLVHDEAYRERVENDPVGALAEIGVQIQQSDLPEGKIMLPPPADILRLWLEDILCDPDIGLSDHYARLFRLH
jgi:hypothetical protein